MYNYRTNILSRYHQLSVDRNIKNNILTDLFLEELSQKELFEVDNIIFYYARNDWESEYFSLNSIWLYFVDFDSNLSKLYNAIQSFKDFLKERYKDYLLTIELPTEDIKLAQYLNLNGFRTIETRLHFFNNELDNFNAPRKKTRQATLEDIPNLRKVASFMRNDFDRFHADILFPIANADKYLETYIENSIKGFSDIVIVPAEDNIPPDSFLTGIFLTDLWKKIDYPISKMVLSAVSSETNKGWYKILISEMTYLLRERGAKSIFLNTQSTNFAVLNTWEKFGYRIGRSSYILTYREESFR